VTESGMKLILWVAAGSLLGATLAIPQPVEPWEMPSLVLDRAAVSDAIRLDEAMAKELPDTDEVRALRALFLEHGLSEANPPYKMVEYDQRQAAIYHATEMLVDRLGPQAFETMRASATEDFVRVFGDGTRDPQNDYEVSVLGGIREVLRQYGAVYRNTVIAPPLTVRVFYKARWNSIHRRAFVEGFSQIELQAYWGWLALHGWGKSLEKREHALVEFADAGGRGTQEAAAMFDFLQGRPNRAAKSLEDLYEASGELRLRNLALGLRHAALLPMGSP
jgi:hypothetical protein